MADSTYVAILTHSGKKELDSLPFKIRGQVLRTIWRLEDRYSAGERPQDIRPIEGRPGSFGIDTGEFRTRGVYQGDDDDQLVAGHPEIQRLAQVIEQRRIDLGKTSGFERLYAKVTKLYFGGMARHLAELRTVLRPGAQLAYVVGDQASYLQVMIHTGQIVADLAQSLEYEVTDIDFFRTRLATATKQQLREEVVLLRWPGITA